MIPGAHGAEFVVRELSNFQQALMDSPMNGAGFEVF